MNHQNPILNFDTPEDEIPLKDRIVLDGRVAHFENRIPSSQNAADIEFLRSLPVTRCWYGACDCELHPFIAVPDIPLVTPPTAASVLGILGAACFSSEHILSLDKVTIGYPGYHPDTENDEIHTESADQSIFLRIEDENGEASAPEEQASLRWHAELKRYVLDGHLYYVLLHTKPHQHGEFEFSEWVILFAVGVSPRSGSLVGAVTHQACHNFCD